MNSPALEKQMFQDFRFSLRMLLAHKGFTSLAVLTLALGIGANTAVFSIIGSVLYPPLPVKEPQRLVSIYSIVKGNYGGTSYPEYLDYRDRLQSYDELAAYGRVPMKLRSGDETEEIGTELVTGNFFSTLGIGASTGRLLTADDDRMAAPVVVVSHRMWRERYGGDPQLIGRSLNLNGQDFTVVGVAPEGFRSILLDWGKQPQVWIPMANQRIAFRGIDMLSNRDTHWMMVVGRLKNGLSIEQAEVETKTLAGQLAASLPKNDEGRSVVLFPTTQARFWPAYRTEIVRVLALLETIAALTLSVACFNVANLLLARAAARRKETSIRLALGAGRLRLARQWLTESLLLALLGAGAGLLISVWLMRLPAIFQSPFKVGLSLAIDPRLDQRALGFTLVIAILTSVIFGLAPVWQSARIGLADALKDAAGRGQTSERAGLRSALVVAQVALALALLTGTGLLVRSLWRIRAIDPGFDSNKVLLIGLDLDPREYDDAKKVAFYRRALERVSELPGIEAASLTNNVPLSMVGFAPRSVEAEDAPAQRVQDRVPASPDYVSPGYFRTLGIRLASGREFNDYDSKGAPPTVIINQTLARRLWPDQDALGRRIKITSEKDPLTVIGIAPDVKYRSLLDASKPYFYLPLYQKLNYWTTLQARTADDPMLFVNSVRQALRDIDSNVFISDVSTINGQIDAALAQTRMTATFAGLLGGIALLLALTGLYGLMAYSVTQRTQELGIRMALGARPADVLYLVLRQGLKLALTGVAAGLVITFALTRLMTSLLYGVSATDPLTLIMTATSLACIAALACYLPARRATRVNPLEALRHD
jgi:putative ABC transport system permease protein